MEINNENCQAGTFQILAGHKIEFLLVQLAAFKSGERSSTNSAMMNTMASGLSNQDMKDLAACFNGQDASGEP